MIGRIVGSVEYLLIALGRQSVAGFVIWLLNNQKIQKFLNIANKSGLKGILKLLTGTSYLDLIKDFTEDQFHHMIDIIKNYDDGWPFYDALTVLITVVIAGVTLSQVLQNFELVYSPVFKVSESFYSGNTADHNAWETNYVNLQSEISSVSPTVQGIIMVPPKLDKINNTKHNFPWETISEYY